MNEPTDFDVVEAMIRHGGHFAVGLGGLYRRADPIYQARLKDAFPELFQKYREIAADRKQRQAATDGAR